MDISRLTRDGTAEPVLRDQILWREREQENIIFPVQLTTSRIDNLTQLNLLLLYVMTIHTYSENGMCKETSQYIRETPWRRSTYLILVRTKKLKYVGHILEHRRYRVETYLLYRVALRNPRPRAPLI